MKPPDDMAELERSGYAVVLREQFESRPAFHQHYEPTSIGFNIPELISLSSPWPRGIWQFLYVLDEGQYDWLDNTLAKIGQLSAGTDKAYADLALRQASHVSQTEPRIYNAPEGGVVIENRTDSGFLTLLIEGPIGLIVRSADDFQVKAEFNLTSRSINELLARYVHELRLLFLPPES